MTATANIAATTATRLPASALETPFTVVTLPEGLIENSAARSFSDVLRYAATIGGQEALGSNAEFFSSRGFELVSRANYFRDGLRYRKYGQVPLYDVGRVEILRGPASVIYGALQPGGVINIVSKKPQAEAEREVRASYGSDNFRQVTADLTGPIYDRTRYRLQGLYDDSESFRDEVETYSYGGVGQVDFDIGPRTELSTRLSYFKDRRTADTGAVLQFQPNGSVDITDASAFFGEPYAFYQFRDVNLQVTLKHELTDAWSLRADVVRSEQKEDRVYLYATANNTPVSAGGLLTRSEGEWHSQLKGTLVRAELAGRFAIGPTSHRLLFGTEAEYFDNDRPVNTVWDGISTININNPVYTRTRPARGAPTSATPYGQRTDFGSVYAQDLIDIGDHVVVLAGLRYDKLKDENKLNGAARYDSDAVTPQFGLVFKPTPTISPYISYTKSFIPQSGVDEFGNGFDPEESDQKEVGIKWDWRKIKTLFTVSAYEINKENVVVFGEYLPNPSVGRLSGEQRSRGVDFSIDSAPIAGLRLGLNYAYIDEAKYVRDTTYTGNTLPNVAKHTAGLWADYTLPGEWNRLSVSGGVTYAGKRFVHANNLYSLPSYTLVDVGVRYALNDNVNVSANVRNLFDEEYYTGAASATSIGAGRPRSFQVALGLKY